MSVISIEVATDEQRQNIELVASYAQVGNISISQGASLRLQCGHPNSQDILTGLNTICRYIASLSIKKDELLGTSDIIKAEVNIQV